MASSAAFTAVKLVGAAYLLFAGLQMLLSRPRPVAEVGIPGDGISLRRVFWQGVLTDVLNPKVALFFLAFLPQFVAADSPHKTLAFLLLGLIFISTGTLWCFGVAAFAARAAGRIRQSQGAIAWINRVLGGMFVYLGVRVAMLQRMTAFIEVEPFRTRQLVERGHGLLVSREFSPARCRPDRCRAGSSRSGTSGGKCRPASACAPPGR